MYIKLDSLDLWQDYSFMSLQQSQTCICSNIYSFPVRDQPSCMSLYVRCNPLNLVVHLS